MALYRIISATIFIALCVAEFQLVTRGKDELGLSLPLIVLALSPVIGFSYFLLGAVLFLIFYICRFCHH